MPRVAKGHIEQLPSGSFRVSVYAGMDALTRRAIRLKTTVKTEQQARIELGRLLKEASEGRTPESGATVARLMDEYAAVAEWDVSTRQTNEYGRCAVPFSTSCTRSSSAAVSCPVRASHSSSTVTSRC
jgi:type IV secretory pathway TrbF-like protein